MTSISPYLWWNWIRFCDGTVTPPARQRDKLRM
jgi:hypothetical protein